MVERQWGQVTIAANSPNLPVALVADDSSTNRRLLAHILRQQGYQAVECINGRQCLDYCECAKPEVVLLDVMMPELDGIEVCRLLRRKFSRDELPIIMVTTKAEGSDVKDGMAAGANDYVTKPVDRTVLLARLENQLSMSRAHQQIERQRALLHRSLEIQHTMGDVLPEALLVHNQDGQVIYCNQRCVHYNNGIKPETIAEVLPSIFGGQLAALHQGFYYGSREDAGGSWEKELRLAEGPYTDMYVRTRPIKTQETGVLRLWLWRDLTELRELERRTQQQVKLEMVSVFTAGVAHNFNNILGSILGAVELLQRGVGGNERYARYISMISAGVDSGRRLTRRLCAVIRDKGAQSCDAGVIRDVLASVAAVAEVRGGGRVRLTLSIAPDVPPVAVARMNLLDMLSSVVENAVDAVAAEGEVIIDVKKAAAASELLIIVQDNGIGMDPETQARMFEPFFSTKNLDHRNQVSMEGNGLGLWNVHSLIAAIGGTIQVSSVPGQGTALTLALPLVSATESG